MRGGFLVRALVSAVVAASVLTSCGGDSSGAGGGSSSTEAADTALETVHRVANLALDDEWADICKLMADDPDEPFKDFPGLLSECEADADPEMFGDVSDAAWQAMLDTPEERVKEYVGESSGDTHLEFSDENARMFSDVRLEQGAKDGLYYLDEVTSKYDLLY